MWASPGRAGVVAAETKQGLPQLHEELVTIHTGNFIGERFQLIKTINNENQNMQRRKVFTYVWCKEWLCRVREEEKE